MKKILLILITLSISILMAQSITVQGVLRDSNNRAVADGDYELSFAIYSASSGGNKLWPASLTHDETLAVLNGVYSLDLPVGFNIQSGSSELWLEVAVDGSTMNDRLRLNLSPYENAAVTGESNKILGTGNIGIGTNAPEHLLHINKTSDINIDDNAPYAFAITKGDDLNLTMTKEGKISTSSDAFIGGSLNVADRIKLRSSGHWSAIDLRHPGEIAEPRLYFFGEDINGGDQNFSIILKDTDANNRITLHSSGAISGEQVYANVFYDPTNTDYHIDIDDYSKLNRVDFSHGYDIDDQTYYINPNGYSYLNSVGLNGGISGNLPVGGRYLLTWEGYYNVFWTLGGQPAGSGARLYFRGRDNEGTEVSLSTFAHTYQYNSDRRLKSNIKPISYGLSTLMNLEPKEYNWKNHPDQKDIGFIAQDVLEVMPEIVTLPQNEDDNYTLRVDGFTPVLTKAIQELKTEKDAEIEALNETVNQLLLRIEQLENR